MKESVLSLKERTTQHWFCNGAMSALAFYCVRTSGEQTCSVYKLYTA